VLQEAYATLSNPEARAAYDAVHPGIRERRWKIFEQAQTALGIEAEKRKRQGILGLLYAQRLNGSRQDGLSAAEMEPLLGCPREHLDFAVWYLKEHGWVLRADNGRCVITAKGVDEAERVGIPTLEPIKLLGEPRAAA
jgi:hypothetical protein